MTSEIDKEWKGKGNYQFVKYVGPIGYRAAFTSEVVTVHQLRSCCGPPFSVTMPTSNASLLQKG